jgi:multiple sugar transport system permease protein
MILTGTKISKKNLFKQNIKKNLTAYSFIAPFFIFISLFSFFPMFKILVLSVKKTGVFTDNARIVWFKNFVEILKTKQYIDAFLNNLYYILMEVPSCIILTLIIAFLLQKKNSLNSVFETVFFLPLLLSMSAAAVVVAYVLSMRGPLNFLLSLFKIEPLNWFGEIGKARVAILVLELWKGSAFFIYTFLAALRNIPKEYSEAAKIDGANLLRQIFHIKLPLIKNTILINTVMTTIWQFQIFESVYLLTGGGPLKKTETIVYNIYRLSFEFDNIGVASAMALLFMLIILTISSLQSRMLKSNIEY